MVTSTTGRSKAERGKGEKKQGKKQEKSEVQEVWQAHGGNEALGAGCYNLSWQKERQSCWIMRLRASPVRSGPEGGGESNSALCPPPRLLPRAVLLCAHPSNHKDPYIDWDWTRWTREPNPGHLGLGPSISRFSNVDGNFIHLRSDTWLLSWAQFHLFSDAFFLLRN